MRILLALLLLIPSPTLALEEVVAGETQMTKDYVIPYVKDFVKTPHGGVSWDIFASTKEIPYSDKDKDGFDIMGVRPGFTADLKALDGKTIIMEGYMFPLEESDAQTRFLFGPFPMSCPYHYHAGPALVIETFAAKPIPFTYDPIQVTGILELIPRDDEANTFYRLKNVTLYKP